MTRVSAVVLAYQDEPWLEQCVRSLLASTRVEVDVVLVDNGCTAPGVVGRLEAELPALTVVRPGTNLGYAGGCNAGADAATGDVLAFVNHEDTDLSVRCWQQGLTVVYVPEAVVVHRYEFSRNTRKLYLVERNRLLNLLTLWQRRTLLVLLPVLAGFEVAMLALATRQGWLGAKVDGYRWLWRHRREVVARRQRVQSVRTVPDRDLTWLLTPRITAANYALPPGAAAGNAALAAYWGGVRR